MADNPDFELGDEYTGPAVTSKGKVINTADGTYVEGGVRYVWTGEGDNFIPEGGWSDTPEQLAANELYVPGSELNPIDPIDNEPALIPVRRADGSIQPGAWVPNPAAYVAPVKPADADTAPPGKYTTTQDERGNTVWNISPDWKGSGQGGEGDGDGDASTDAFGQWTISQQQATAAAAAADLQSAREILAGMMEEFGLPSSLTDKLNAELVRGESPTALAMRIRTTEEYKARFPGMVLRRDLKLPAITEAEYLDLESQYRSIMRAANLPPTFHDAPEDFTTLIAGDVSGQELQQRVALAESARETANQDIITELQDNYGLTEGDLTAYYLDPGAAKNIFEERRMYEAAGLSVAATQAIGEGLEVKTAEALQRENIQRREIQSRLGQRAGLTEDLLGSEGMSATEIAEAEFGLDVDEATRLRRLREARLAPTMGAGTALTTAQGITGLGAAQ
jgi:hypothetical protein